MGKYDQSREAKEKFNSPLYTYMLSVLSYEPEHLFTREELREVLQMSDRQVRKEMERIANYHPLIATSNRKGYKLALFSDTDSKEDMIALLREVEHEIAELSSRVNSLYARMNPLIAMKVELEQSIRYK